MKRIVTLFLAGAIAMLAAPPARKTVTSGKKEEVIAGAPRGEARIVEYKSGEAVHIYVQHGWQTIVELPKDETYLDFLCGDTKTRKEQADHWVINSFKGANYVSVRPLANTLTSTDLTITAESGHNVTLVLDDVTHVADAHADTTVVIRPPDFVEELVVAKPEVTALEHDIADVKLALTRMDDRLASQDRRIEEGLTQNKQAALIQDAGSPRERYKYNHRKAEKDPFRVRDIWTAQGHTFIAIDAEEAPAFCEFKDGKPNWTNWDFKGGVYFVPHVVDKGELKIGKKKLMFERRLHA